MDLNDIRSVVSVISLAIFVGICAWAWSRRNQADFEAAAHRDASSAALLRGRRRQA